jgi:DNA-binding transcriptional regulator YiaG
MPNIAAVLKNEIARVAKKELRQEIAALRKSVSTHRSEIAALKRTLQEQQKALKALQKARPAQAESSADEGDADGSRLRFSAARLAAQRKRLGLSAQDFGRLVGATGQAVYNWETGKARPRADKLAVIAELRHVGKRELQARLAALG